MSHLPGGESRVRVKGCCRSILRGLSCPYWRPSTKGSVPVHSGGYLESCIFSTNVGEWYNQESTTDSHLCIGNTSEVH